MRADVIEDIEIKGTLDLEGQTWPIKIRLRGASTRFAAKKSYRVEFTETSPFPRDVIYLKAEPMDHTMQQEKLSSDHVSLAMTLSASKAEYINLVLNDRYEGVYLDVEPLRVPFKNNPGLDPDGILIRASTFGWWQQKPIGKLRGKGEGLAHLETFLTEARTVRNEEFETWLRNAYGLASSSGLPRTSNPLPPIRD
jgi:spore coat protein CotH